MSKKSGLTPLSEFFFQLFFRVVMFLVGQLCLAKCPFPTFSPSHFPHDKNRVITADNYKKMAQDNAEDVNIYKMSAKMPCNFLVCWSLTYCQTIIKKITLVNYAASTASWLTIEFGQKI